MARVGLEAQRVGLVPGGEGKRLFAIDSFNVHRLVIAGVTVASKFFSDVFYTNSRYAKVRPVTLPSDTEADPSGHNPSRRTSLDRA